MRVGKNARTWIMVCGKNRERVTIGRYPDLYRSDARGEAKLLSTAPEPKQLSKTFAEAWAKFLEEHYRDKAPRTK